MKTVSFSRSQSEAQSGPQSAFRPLDCGPAGAICDLLKLDIAPCQACDVCRKTGECAQKDDMAALLEKMHRSQAWVLGTPVYYYGPTAQFKAFLDR